MYIIDKEFENVLKSDEQQYDTYIILQDGTKVDEDISGFKVIYNLGEKIIGNFATKRVEFTLFNTSMYNITNQEFEVFVGLKINNIFNYISIGKFIADKPEVKDEALDECTIIAHNYSLKFKIPYTPILSFPCTIKEAIKSICDYLGIRNLQNEFINSDYVLQEFFINDDATFFDVIKILVEAGFANADVNNENSLIIKSPSKTIDYTFSLDELFELKKEDNKFGPVNSIVASRIVADDGSTTEDVFARDETSITDNGIYEYKITQNDAMDYDRQTAVNNILAGILNFEYIPAKIEAIYNPAIEIGDMLEVPDVKTDTSFLLFVKELSADLSTGLMTIESTEKTQTETDYKKATTKDKRKRTEAEVNKLKGTINLLTEEKEANTQKIAQLELTVNTINSSIKLIGGNNLQSNSIGAYGTEDYEQSEEGTIVATEEELLKSSTDNGFGRIIYIGANKWFKFKSEGLTIGNSYTLSFKYSNTLNNQCTIKLINNTETTVVSTLEEKEFEEIEYTFIANTEIVELYVSTGDYTLGITDYYLQAGTEASKWQPATGEVLSTALSIYYNGIEVTSENSEIITKISNLGFSVVNINGKVLITFNKDKCILADTDINGTLNQSEWLRYVQTINGKKVLLEVKI